MEKEVTVSEKKPLQTKWFKIGKGYLCFSILKLPNIAFTIEFRRGKNSDEFALCIISFAVVYTWDRKIV